MTAQTHKPFKKNPHTLSAAIRNENVQNTKITPLLLTSRQNCANICNGTNINHIRLNGCFILEKS